MTRLITINLLLSLILFGGCGDVGTADSEGLQIRMAAASSCTSHGNSDNSKVRPLGASSVVVRLTGGEEEFVRRVEEREDGIYVIPGIEPATDMKLEVVACNGASASWAGVTTGVDVEEHEKTFPAIFLTPIGGPRRSAALRRGPLRTGQPAPLPASAAPAPRVPLIHLSGAVACAWRPQPAVPPVPAGAPPRIPPRPPPPPRSPHRATGRRWQKAGPLRVALQAFHGAAVGFGGAAGARRAWRRGL